MFYRFDQGQKQKVFVKRLLEKGIYFASQAGKHSASLPAAHTLTDRFQRFSDTAHTPDSRFKHFSLACLKETRDGYRPEYDLLERSGLFY
ncbi:hypothetical protein [Pantoea coffeiphila]|uniref:hypothetical protein n=1 Tax=Pantoea coffeiphila TaxID=1465635 RepID=UPI0019600363|nr:hypothetical protein [Pantoea coffeiphila]MBM7342189.1 hypothetical protein [Pantoea coffeiphila]